ncbi:MAG: cytochrome c [Gemmatimonadales bacterium]|jgi:mono/diheme cytochrome c family protein|nr:cytochrome c [Gemmatimonadales bacterium]MBT3774963.1 cytochrome c [Gemmatimonadales bacterium]MBT3958298.1 cytochrome c [Gemmatimonadales bacterium]MBT4188422.1 cytochrome c [Gemmatimonadales bacterium]MBT4436382.1 cytochrome c [Gemmatimonadales bacterium]
MRAFLLVATVVLGSPSIVDAQSPRNAELTAFERSRTERFLKDRLACLGCHRLGSEGGAIGPALDQLADRSDLDYVVRMIQNPSGTVPGTLMPRQPMPALEARRLATYLMTTSSLTIVPPAQTQAPPALAPGAQEDGPALYARHCAACHGESGAGDGWNAANLPTSPTAHADAVLMSARADDTLYDGISAGGFVLDRSNLMPAFGELLSPTQIRALVAHIRTLCACEGPPWSNGAVR